MEAHVVKLANAHGGHWGEHPDHPSEDWRREVWQEEERLGYWEWVQSILDHAPEEPE